VDFALTDPLIGRYVIPESKREEWASRGSRIAPPREGVAAAAPVYLSR